MIKPLKTNYPGHFKDRGTKYVDYEKPAGDPDRIGLVIEIQRSELCRYAVVQFKTYTANIPLIPTYTSKTRGGARKNAGRKAGDKGVKKQTTVALYPCDKETIIKRYGSVQAWADACIPNY